MGEVRGQTSLHLQDKFFTEPMITGVTMPGMLLPVGMLLLGAGLLYAAVPRLALTLVTPRLR